MTDYKPLPTWVRKTCYFYAVKTEWHGKYTEPKEQFNCFWYSECEDLSQVWMEKISKGVSTLDFETGKNDEFSLK